VNQLLWVLFAIVFGDADWFELPRVVPGGDVAGESWEPITIVDIAEIIAVLTASRLDDVSSVTAFVDFVP
jgi:hypothetical protein